MDGSFDAQTMMHPKQYPRRAFTVLELGVVILILAILAGVLVPRVTDRLAIARDTRRLSDLRVLRDAIEQYHRDKGAYPPAVVAAGAGFDVTCDNGFLPDLLKSGYLREAVADPINDASHFYAYNVFPEGTHACKGKGSYYVLGIKKFESAAFSAEHPGYFKCAQQDWSAEFEYVCGGGTSEQDPNAVAPAGSK